MGVLDTRFEGALSLLTRFFFFPATIEGTLMLAIVEAPDTLALEVFEVLEFCVDACLEALVDVQVNASKNKKRTVDNDKKKSN